MSWSTSHTSKTTRPPISSTPIKIRKTLPQPPVMMSISSDLPLYSRTNSLAGRKRPRESEGDSKPKPARRTKSLGSPMDASVNAKDREALQRGLIAVFVPKALQESMRGNMTHYNELLAHFLPSAGDTPIALPPLLPLLRAISAHVSALSPQLHGALVSAIIGLPWATGDDRFVKSFVGFAGVLVSSEPAWTKEVVGMAVKGLSWQPIYPSASTITRRIFHARHHLLLSHLISLIPTLPNILSPLLIRHFPHKREPEVSQTTYVRNICELIGYCPELGQRVWGEIVDRMLRIDVEITQRSEDDEDEDDEEDEEPVAGPSTQPDPFDLLISQNVPRERSLSPSDDGDESDADADPDPEDLSSGDEGGSDQEEPSSDAKELLQREKKRLILQSMRAKLDGMLSYFYEHLAEYMGGRGLHAPAAEMAAAHLMSSGQSTPTTEVPTTSTAPSLAIRRPTPSPAESLSHFQTLLNIFSRQILPTASTQHIPFLLFLTSSFSNAHTDLLLGLLVQQALYATVSGSTQPISLNQRVAAAVYIGSIVSRARFVTDDQARTVITYLLAYIDGKLLQSRTSKTDELPLFYAVCQAAMVIFCFRWRAFTTDENPSEGIVGEMELESEGEEDLSNGNNKWLKDLDILQRAITSELNPLLGCNPTVVDTFAKVAHKTNFLYCFSIIESNTSAARTSSSSSTSLSRSSSYHKLAASLSVPKSARQINVDAGLDSYFPFDPYDLPRSGVWIERIYRTYNEVAVEEEDDSDDDSGEDEDDDEESESSDSFPDEGVLQTRLGGTPRSLPKPKMGSFDKRRFIRDNGLSTSLEGMSISPTISMKG